MQLSNKPALTSKVYDVADFSAAQELFHANGWTDGLPVVPPTQEAVEACLDWALMPPDQLSSADLAQDDGAADDYDTSDDSTDDSGFDSSSDDI